jgi:tRNA splicing endonuclease
LACRIGVRLNQERRAQGPPYGNCMNPLERASRLRQEADLVLQKVGVYDILRPHGRIVPTGSYFLDVMVYPDIDLMMSRVSIEQLFQIGGRLASSDLVFEVVFAKSRDAELPGGLYLKPRIDYGDWGRPWKIDIWSLDDPVIDQKMEPMARFKSEMVDPIREQIIRYKLSIMTAEKRTPMYSGYFIYKAFIDEGMTDFQQVTRYLIDNGISVE